MKKGNLLFYFFIAGISLISLSCDKDEPTPDFLIGIWELEEIEWANVLPERYKENNERTYQPIEQGLTKYEFEFKADNTFEEDFTFVNDFGQLQSASFEGEFNRAVEGKLTLDYEDTDEDEWNIDEVTAEELSLSKERSVTIWEENEDGTDSTQVTVTFTEIWRFEK